MIRALFNFETFGLIACVGVLLACRGSNDTGWHYERLYRDAVNGDVVAVTCEGTQQQCYIGAKRACPSGFRIEDAAGRVDVEQRGFMATGADGNPQAFSRTDTQYGGDLLIRCTPTARLTKQ